MSGYLLDSHTLIWWWIDSPRLGRQARAVIAGDADIAVSAASVWEIAIKSNLGKLPEIEDFRRDYAPLMTRDGFARVDVTDVHTMRAGYLPGQHRDPFDRLIAAQALIENLVVITRDAAFDTFGCQTLW